jgi:hypothetical protein
MKSLLLPRVVCLTALITISTAQVTRAGLLSATDASTLIQSTASDLDATYLGLFVGFHPGQTLRYNSISSTTAWSATLVGPYDGPVLGLSYAGDLSNYSSGGAVTWNTSGSYGVQSWSGSGSATITDTSATTFQVGLLYSMTLDGNSGSIAYVIPGTVSLGGMIMFGNPANPEAGTGTVNVNGTQYLSIVGFSYKSDPSIFQIPSDISILGSTTAENKYTGDRNDPQPGQFTLSGTITSVPEPSSLALLGFGLLAAITLRK